MHVRKTCSRIYNSVVLRLPSRIEIQARWGNVHPMVKYRLFVTVTALCLAGFFAGGVVFRVSH